MFRFGLDGLGVGCLDLSWMGWGGVFRFELDGLGVGCLDFSWMGWG